MRFSLLLLAGLSELAHAHEGLPRPDSHAPAGVMYDHLHRQGEWMVGYRLMFQGQQDLHKGSDAVRDAAVLAAGYSSLPERMLMRMHMLDIMYAPTDSLTLMLMPQYVDMAMDMTMYGVDQGHGGHGGGGMPGMAMSHAHGTSGLGDTQLAALYRLVDGDRHQLHATLAFSAPTGDIGKHGSNGRVTHYGMQLGSGTWDALPSLTYTGRMDRLSWGAQAGATVRMESENDKGYQLGDGVQLTTWGAYRALPWLSVSARLAWSRTRDINGHYNVPHNHSSPADRQPNYGGEVLEAGLGANVVVPAGVFGTHRIAVEWLAPVSESVNGYQLARERTLFLNWSTAF